MQPESVGQIAGFGGVVGALLLLVRYIIATNNETATKVAQIHSDTYKELDRRQAEREIKLTEVLKDGIISREDLAVTMTKLDNSIQQNTSITQRAADTVGAAGNASKSLNALVVKLLNKKM